MQEAPPAPAITTQRLVLRPFYDGDRAVLAAMDADPMVMRFINDGRTHDAAAFEERWRRLYRPHSREGAALGFWAAAFREAPAAMLGWVCLTPFAGGPMIELGYRFPRQLWGRGVAAEAARPLLARAFLQLGLDHLVAVIDARNLRSAQLARRLGFARSGERFLPSHAWSPQSRYADLHALSAAAYLGRLT